MSTRSDTEDYEDIEDEQISIVIDAAIGIFIYVLGPVRSFFKKKPKTT